MKAPDEDFDRDAMLHGLGLGVFTVIGLLLDEMAVVRPDGTEVLRRIRSTSLDMIARMAPAFDGMYGAAVRDNAEGAVDSIFTRTLIGDDVPRLPDDRDQV